MLEFQLQYGGSHHPSALAPSMMCFIPGINAFLTGWMYLKLLWSTVHHPSQCPLGKEMTRTSFAGTSSWWQKLQFQRLSMYLKLLARKIQYHTFANGMTMLMISFNRGTPNVTFLDDTPAKWKVFRVIWVAGSPIDCAAKAPTISPGVACACMNLLSISPSNHSNASSESLCCSATSFEQSVERTRHWKVVLIDDYIV